MVIQRVENQTYYCQDLLSLAIIPFHLTRLKRFRSSADCTPESTLALAARDKDEKAVLKITDHQGNPKVRKDMKFLVNWVGDEPGEETWEPWEGVKHLEILDSYIKEHHELKSLIHNKLLIMQNRDRVGDARRQRGRKPKKK